MSDPTRSVDPLVAQLRNARRSRGVTGRKLADELNVTQACISYWETGAREISLADARRYAAALGYELDLTIPQATTIGVKPIVLTVELMGGALVCRREEGSQ